jgi:RNA polymerase sigma-70 factor (ECF subfamily)
MEDKISVILNSNKYRGTGLWQEYLTLIYKHKGKAKLTNTATLIEKVLVLRLKNGDSQAFNIIFTAYYKDLVLFALKFTHEKNNAEEIVQATFVNLWLEHESINVSFSLKSYLLKIVQNRCIDWHRHKAIMQTHNNYIVENAPQFTYETDSYLLYSELHDPIESTLNKLPREISEVFRMNRNRGLKYREIADLLGVSVRTIEVRIS